MSDELITIEETNSSIELLPGFSIPENATVEQRRMFSRYMRASSPLQDVENTVIQCMGVIAHDDFRRNENGEFPFVDQLREADRTLLDSTYIDEDGNERALVRCKRTVFLVQDKEGHEHCLHTFSPSVYGFVTRKLLPLWSNGHMGNLLEIVPLRVFKQKSKSGYKYLMLDFA